MTAIEVNGHEITHRSNPNPYGSVHTYRCEHEECFIETSGEFGAREYIKDLAERFPCPSGIARCMVCNHEIVPESEICKKCSLNLNVGDKIFR